jgi:hypothetical protein
VRVRRSGVVAVGVLAGWTAPIAAQRQGAVLEWGLHATATAASDTLGLVLGPRFAVRSVGGTRLALSLGAGIRGERSTGRGTVALEYVLSPRIGKGTSVYIGGGLVGVAGGGNGGYLMAYAGLERSPGLPSGWALEAGLGGGIRIRAAYHWRRFPRGWRPQ